MYFVFLQPCSLSHSFTHSLSLSHSQEFYLNLLNKLEEAEHSNCDNNSERDRGIGEEKDIHESKEGKEVQTEQLIKQAQSPFRGELLQTIEGLNNTMDPSFRREKKIGFLDLSVQVGDVD